MNIKQTTNLLIFFIMLVFTSCGPSSEDLTNQGKKKLSVNKFKEAISLFDAAIKEDANNMDAYNSRGYAQMALQEYSKANSDFTKAIEIYVETEEDVPNAYRFYYNRGNVKRFQNDNKGAVIDYTQAIQLDATIYDIYLNRGLANAEVEGFTASVQDFDKAIDLANGSDKRIFLHKARILMLSKQFDLAIASLDKAIALDPNYGEAYYYKALSLSGKVGKADEKVCKMLAMSESLGYTEASAALAKYCN
ncbi:tetratricopeptide repeat protein [Flammeovirga kamogawensis]|nr:tetratricopeptide repeat protein [Flammeovirga kamogawensis]